MISLRQLREPVEQRLRAERLRVSARDAVSSYRPHEAAVKLRRALGILGEGADPDQAELKIRVLLTLAYAEGEVHGFYDGVEHLRTAEKQLVDVVDPQLLVRLEAAIDGQHGLMLMRVNRLDESLVKFDRAIAIYERAWAQGLRDHFGLGSDLCNRGLVHVALGRPRAAQRDLQHCIEVVEDGLANDSPDKAALAQLGTYAWHNMGTIARRSGDIPTALRDYREVARILQETAPSALPKIRRDYAEAFLAGGLAQEAAIQLDEAIPELQRQRDHQNLAEAEALRAAAALIEGDHATARRMASSARRRFLRRGNATWAAIAALTRLRSEAVAALEAGRVAKVLPPRALALAEELAGLRLADEAAVARMLAVRLELRRGAIDVATARLAEIPTPRRVSPVDHRMLLRLCKAELAVATGRRRSVFAQARGGLAELGRLRDRLGGLEMVSGTAVHGRELGELAVRLVLQDRKVDARQLFDWLERTRAQVYRYDPLPPMDDAELEDRVQEYRMLSRQVQQARVAGKKVHDLIAKHSAMQREVMRLGWRETPWGRPRPIASLAEVMSRIGDRALVSYVVSGDGIGAVVVADGRARFVRLGAALDAANAARELRADLDVLSPDHLARPIAEAVSNSAQLRAARLDEQLLRPLAGIIGDRELVVVPTGALYAVAWGTLPSLRGRPLTVAPSATAWLTAMRSPAPASGRTVLAVGPDLQSAVGEMSRLRDHYPDAVLLDGPDAGVHDVLTALDGARLAHVAAHGTHEPENALFSRLELADGALYAHEMSRLRTPPEHVVLAACELGVARIRPGDEALGFAGVLLAIGCHTVTASVTRVGDLTAATSMADYHGRLAAGMQPAVALAETTAIDPLRRPFILMGASSAQA